MDDNCLKINWKKQEGRNEKKEHIASSDSIYGRHSMELIPHLGYLRIQATAR